MLLCLFLTKSDSKSQRSRMLWLKSGINGIMDQRLLEYVRGVYWKVSKCYKRHNTLHLSGLIPYQISRYECLFVLILITGSDKLLQSDIYDNKLVGELYWKQRIFCFRKSTLACPLGIIRWNPPCWMVVSDK